MKGNPLQNIAFRLAQAYLVLLPFNITFFLGERRVMPADLVLPLLVMSVLPALPAMAGKLRREDRPVLLYFALVLAAAAAACVTGGIRSIDPLALAPVAVALALYLSFRAAGESREKVFSLLRLWAVVSTVAAAVSIAALLLAMSGIGNPLVRWYPNLGPGAWRIIGTVGQTPNFGYSYFHAGLFICLGLYMAHKSGYLRQEGLLSTERGLAIALALHISVVFLTFSRGVLGALLGVIIISQTVRRRLGAGSAGYTIGVWTVFLAVLVYGLVFYTYTTDATWTGSDREAASLEPGSGPGRSPYSYKNTQHLGPDAGYIRLPGGFTFLPSQHWYLQKASWRMFTRNPMFGAGPGQYHNSLAGLRQEGVVPPGMPDQDPHSTVMGTLAETGLAGFAGLAALWLFLLGAGRMRSLRADPAGLALYAALAGYLLSGLNMDIMSFRWLWVMVALAVAYAGGREEEA